MQEKGFAAANAGDDAMALLNRGGLASMLKSFILIYICFYFAGIMEQIGAIEVLLGKLLTSVKTRFGLIFATSISVIVLVAIGGKLFTGVDSHRRNVQREIQRDGPFHTEPVKNHGRLWNWFGWIYSLVRIRRLLPFRSGCTYHSISAVLLHELRSMGARLCICCNWHLHQAIRKRNC